MVSKPNRRTLPIPQITSSPSRTVASQRRDQARNAAKDRGKGTQKFVCETESNLTNRSAPTCLGKRQLRQHVLPRHRVPSRQRRTLPSPNSVRFSTTDCLSKSAPPQNRSDPPTESRACIPARLAGNIHRPRRGTSVHGSRSGRNTHRAFTRAPIQSAFLFQMGTSGGTLDQISRPPPGRRPDNVLPLTDKSPSVGQRKTPRRSGVM